MSGAFCRAAAVAVCVIGATSAAHADIVNYDDFDLEGERFVYPMEEYAGLYYINFGCLDSERTDEDLGYSGYSVAAVSGTQAAFQGFAAPSTLVALAGFPFDLAGGYFTAAWRDDLQIRVRAFEGEDNTEIYNEVFTLNTLEAIYLDLGIAGARMVTFETWGGTDAGYIGAGTHFAMDNIDVTLVPAPGAMLLLGFGACTRRSRRRA